MIEHLGKLDSVPADLPWLFERRGCVQFTFRHARDYLSPSTPLALNVLLNHDDAGHRCLITADEIAINPEDSDDAFDKVAVELALQPINLDSPLPLEPVFIPKPWGQEIWYSGIEARGISTTNGVPIAWLLDIYGDYLGCTAAPVLLKILDPFPDENLGDLYFELHEQKREVYIVTHVDLQAWPEGIGSIRYGFDDQRLAGFADKDAFLVAYLKAVEDYEQTRRTIDRQLAALKKDRGLPLNEATSPAILNALLAEIPTALTDQETEQREAMYGFTALKPISTGDVVTVQPYVPHSLQHGVRVVEFQTPHYERHILSFGQQVITQDHWDTRQALEKAIIEGADSTAPAEIEPGHDLVADFDAFRVERYTINPGASVSLDVDSYTIVMGITGTFKLDGQTVGAETAWFVAASEGPTVMINTSDKQSILLIAAEKGG